MQGIHSLLCRPIYAIFTASSPGVVGGAEASRMNLSAKLGFGV
jgi:hypothetical protein